MKILVTGHRGFIGQNLVEKFTNIGTDELGFFEWGDPLPVVSNYDWVVHLGAISSTTESDVEKVMVQNYDFSKWLLRECVGAGVNLQYSSSASVYGLGTEFSEDSPVDPRSPYAWSKYLFDRTVLAQLRHGTGNPIIQGFRYFNVYGPHEEHKGNQASPHHKFTEQAKNNGVIKLFVNSDNYLRDFVPVEMVVDVHRRFLTVTESGIFNVGTGAATSFAEVARGIAERYGAKIEHIPMPEALKSQYQAYTKADVSKLVKHLSAV